MTGGRDGLAWSSGLAGLGWLAGFACVAGLGVAVVAAPALWTRWRSRGRVLTAAQAPTREVAIVFGAQVHPNGRPSRYLQARLDLGVRLYRDGKATVLLVSGDDAAEHHHETTSMVRYLRDHGVPDEAIVTDPHGVDTFATCVRAREVYGLSEALLVSQRYHLPRAVATCRAVGVDAVGVGDLSVKATSRRWGEFWRRELGANLKMVADLLGRRAPVGT